MDVETPHFSFQQIHIDVARNATDDFNLFHDPHNWHKIRNNPFGGIIALGFQLESVIENRILHYRIHNDEQAVIARNKLNFSNYQFNFTSAVKPGDEIDIAIKRSHYKEVDNTTILGNRVSVTAGGKLALTGYKKESSSPLFLTDADFSHLGNLKLLPDRSMLPNADFFLKRKFMNNSNAKNFLCSSFTDQSIYFDELNDTVSFPEIFPCSLISNVLLEKSHLHHHDFERNPMVYTSHKISINRTLLEKLKSNDVLHILVRELPQRLNCYECYGLVEDNQILYRGVISLAALA